MAIIDDKKSVFTEIGALTSIADAPQLPFKSDSLSSINNNSDINGFLVEILTTLIGSESLKGLIGGILKDFLEPTEPLLRNELTNQLTDFDSSTQIPADFVNNGYNVPAKDIDIFDKLRTDPASDVGGLIYDDSVNNFDSKSYEAIVTPNVPVSFNGILITYLDATDEFNYKHDGSSQIGIGGFISSFIRDIKLFDTKTFITGLLDIIFGTASSAQNKTEQQILNDLKFEKTIQKFIDEEEDISISNNELRELENNARQRHNGVSEVNVGCAIIESSISQDDINEIVNLVNNPNSNPDEIGNTLANKINNSFDFGAQDQGNANQKTIQDGLLKRILNAILQVLIKSITATPQIRALLALIEGFRNDGVIQLGNPLDFLVNKRKLIQCLIKRAKALIVEFIFNLVKEQLLKLIIPVSKIILREKINQYLNILRSLIGFG